MRGVTADCRSPWWPERPPAPCSCVGSGVSGSKRDPSQTRRRGEPRRGVRWRPTGRLRPLRRRGCCPPAVIGPKPDPPGAEPETPRGDTWSHAPALAHPGLRKAGGQQPRRRRGRRRPVGRHRTPPRGSPRLRVREGSRFEPETPDSIHEHGAGGRPGPHGRQPAVPPLTGPPSGC